MGKIKLGALILAVLVIALCLFEAGGMFSSAQEKKVMIEAGDSFLTITKKLKSQEVIGSQLLFRAYGKVAGGKALGGIQNGEASFNGKLSYGKILKVLTGSERTLSDVSVTIPEGYELREIADLLEKKELINKAAFYEAVSNYDFPYEVIRNLPKGENRLEGFLFPDTYLISKTNDTEITIIEKMLARFFQVYEEFKPDEKKLNMTTYEIVTLASIIEREALFDQDFFKVSSVFHNRLKRTDYLKYLQSCATVQYILKERKAVLSESDTKIDSPYNTYRYPYLPAGPISSPGKQALHAAVAPEETNFLFFLNDERGRLHFSKTYEEHQKKTREYVN